MLRLGDLAFISGTVGFLAVALLLLVPQVLQQPELPPPKISKLDVSCWAPAQFTDSHREYANTLCRILLVNNKTHAPAEERIPGDVNRNAMFNIYDDLDVSQNESGWRQPVAILVVFEILVVYGFYALYRIGRRGDSALCRIVQAAGHVIAIAFLFIASFVPHISLVGKKQSTTELQDVRSGVVLCPFEVRHVSRIHSYVVQCAYSFEVPSFAGGDVSALLTLNGVICGVVVISAIGSFISMFISDKSEIPDKSEEAE